MPSLDAYLFALDPAPDEILVASGLTALDLTTAGTGTCGVTTQGFGLLQQRGLHRHERHINDNQMAGQAAIERVVVRLLEAHRGGVDDNIEVAGREGLDATTPAGTQILGQGRTAFGTAVEHRDPSRCLHATEDHRAGCAARKP